MTKRKVVELAPIESGSVYPLAEFMKRSGLGAYAMKRARADGLKVISVSSRLYVRGVDFHDFCATQAQRQFAATENVVSK